MKPATAKGPMKHPVAATAAGKRFHKPMMVQKTNENTVRNILRKGETQNTNIAWDTSDPKFLKNRKFLNINITHLKTPTFGFI